MEAAKKIVFACGCGAVTDLACDRCGKPLCSSCSTRQIVSLDLQAIEIRHYCSGCSEDENRNAWGRLYWETLVTRYS